MRLFGAPGHSGTHRRFVKAGEAAGTGFHAGQSVGILDEEVLADTFPAHPAALLLMTVTTMRSGPVPVLLCAVALAGCGADGSARAKVGLFGAASTTDALDEIRARFEQTHDAQVRANYASSATLAHQIESGAGADVFLSANVQWVDYLEDKGLVARRRDLLGNRLVVVVPSDSQLRVASLEDLLGEPIERLALGDPEAVPAGIYAKQALVNKGLWERVQKKVVAADDVRRALFYVETGNAQAGIVYSTDAAISDSVKVALEIDADLSDPIRYPLVLLGQGAERPAAVSLFDYLGGPEAAEVFRKHGFTVLEAPAPRQE